MWDGVVGYAKRDVAILWREASCVGARQKQRTWAAHVKLEMTQDNERLRGNQWVGKLKGPELNGLLRADLAAPLMTS